MIYAFGWNRLLPLPGEWACVAVWATWAWPVAALLLGSAWRATGRDRWEAALLVTSRWRAIVDVVFPMLWRPALVCFCVLFAFFLGDYAVPHACGLIVGATELLLAAESAAHPAAVLGAAMPAAGAISDGAGVGGVHLAAHGSTGRRRGTRRVRIAGGSIRRSRILDADCSGGPVVGIAARNRLVSFT
jgi:hypothetical protein